MAQATKQLFGTASPAKASSILTNPLTNGAINENNRLKKSQKKKKKVLDDMFRSGTLLGAGM